jgi:tetratricopeptide (TPR) repeat protein
VARRVPGSPGAPTPEVLEARILAHRGDLEGALAAAAKASAAAAHWGEPYDRGWTLAEEALLRLEAGEHGAAVRLLESARKIGPYADDPGGALILHTARCLLDPRSADAARATFREHHEKSPHLEAMECAFRIYQATGDPELLGEACRRLDHLVAHAPEEYRETMVGRVTLYRGIREATEALPARPIQGEGQER